MIGVAGVGVSHDLAVNLCAALKRVFKRLENEDRTAVCHDETAPVGVERQGCVMRIFRAGKGLGVCETGDSDRDGGIFATSGDDGVGVASGDGPEGLAQAVRRGCARRHYIEAGALCEVLDGDVARGYVTYHRRDEHRGNPLSAGIFHHLGYLTGHDFESAYAGTYVHSEPGGVDIGAFAFAVKACVVHGLIGGRDSVLGEYALFTHERLVHAVLERVEVLYPAGNVNRQQAGIVFVYGIDAADAVLELVPERGNVVSEGGDNSQPGYDNSVLFHIIMAFGLGLYSLQR